MSLPKCPNGIFSTKKKKKKKKKKKRSPNVNVFWSVGQLLLRS